MLEGGGWKMLPGLYPTGKSLELDVSYKVKANKLHAAHAYALQLKSLSYHFMHVTCASLTRKRAAAHVAGSPAAVGMLLSQK